MASVSGYSSVLQFANGASSTLAGAISNTAVTAQLATGTGALFPAPAAGQAFVGTFIDAATGLRNEVVLVSQMSGDQIVTMARAQEGTVAQNWNANDFFYMLGTAGTQATFIQQQQAQPARTVTASTSFTAGNLDGGLLLNRTTSVAAMTITLPVTPTNGQLIEIADGVGNFNADPVTVAPNANQSIAGEPGAVVLAVNRQVGQFRYYSTSPVAGIWSFKP